MSNEFRELIDSFINGNKKYCADEMAAMDNDQVIYFLKYVQEFDNQFFEQITFLYLEIRNEKIKNEISIKWHIDDVKWRAKENGCKISDNQARDILAVMKKRHDCNYGVSWETIDAYLDNLKRGDLR